MSREEREALGRVCAFPPTLLTEDLEEAGEVVGPEGDFDGVGFDGAGRIVDGRAADDLLAVR